MDDGYAARANAILASVDSRYLSRAYCFNLSHIQIAQAACGGFAEARLNMKSSIHATHFLNRTLGSLR